MGLENKGGDVVVCGGSRIKNTKIPSQQKRPGRALAEAPLS